MVPSFPGFITETGVIHGPSGRGVVGGLLIGDLNICFECYSISFIDALYDAIQHNKYPLESCITKED